jgi:hypothetical protein
VWPPQPLHLMNDEWRSEKGADPSVVFLCCLQCLITFRVHWVLQDSVSEFTGCYRI